MKKKVLWAIGLILIPIVLSCVLIILSSSVKALDGTCCMEMYSICGLNGKNYENYYYKSEGPCNPNY